MYLFLNTTIFMVYEYVVGGFPLTFQGHCAVWLYKNNKFNVVL